MHLTNHIFGAVWEMFDLTGRQARKGRIAKGGPLTQINCNRLPRGVYVMRVRFAEGGQWTQKVVLEQGFIGKGF
jgi:hypothetical protein